MMKAVYLLSWLLLVNDIYCSSGETTGDDAEGVEHSSSASTALRDCEDHQHGSKWTRSKCILCECTNGLTTCGRDPSCCEKSRQIHLTPYESQFYGDGETWSNGCSTCRCRGGVETCPLRACHTVDLPGPNETDCPQPHHVKDRCGCKVLNCYKSCEVELNSFWFGSSVRRYRERETWIESRTGDRCGIRICVHGEQFRRNDSCPQRSRVESDDCYMSQWSSWETCSQPCGFGNSTRRRKVYRHRMSNSSCPPTLEVRYCISRHCHGNSSRRNEPHNVKSSHGDHERSLYVKDSNGCRSVSRVSTTLCGMNKCKRYGLQNVPLGPETIDVSLKCRNGTVLPNRLFAKVTKCGCMPQH